jgi:norsolorinic acid ketoreductase
MPQVSNAVRRKRITVTPDQMDLCPQSSVARIGQSVADISVEEMLDHFQTNTIGPLVLYQRTKPLLAKSSNAKFAVISSAAASVSIQANFPYNHTSYSVSKGALNIIGARLAVEEKDKTIILMLHPGAVHTDMWQSLLVALDVPFVDLGFPMLTAEESAAFVLKTIDDATHADSGRFINATTGDTIPW